MATTEETQSTTATEEPKPKTKEKKPWDPSKGKQSGCPVCGIIPPLSVTVQVQTPFGKMFRTWRHDITKPAAYQALKVHMHGVPAEPPGPMYPQGLPAIPGMHPEAKMPPEPAADIRARAEEEDE